MTAGKPLRPKLTLAERRAFRAEVEVPAEDGRPPAKMETWRRIACENCGGIHERTCPRVRRMVYGAGGVVTEIEFWAHGQWPTDDVIWPEDILIEDPTDKTHVLVAKKDLRTVVDALGELAEPYISRQALVQARSRLEKLARDGRAEQELEEAPRDGIRS